LRRLVLVSNRLPVTAKVERGELVVTPSSGGLATGLRGPHEQSSGLWIGWPGDISRMTDGHRSDLEAKLKELRTVPLHLTAREVDRFYEGYSNGVLWPLFHYLLDRVPLETRDWDTYRKVNERFAEAVIANYQPGDLIWIHDYQLMLVPGMLRKRLHDARIGFFLHIPFPSSEVFRILASRTEILEGLLGADIIGFHTFTFMRHFATSLLRILGVEPDVDVVRVEGRPVRFMACPMGIDAAAFSALAEEEEIKVEAMAIRGPDPDLKILVGIDRLDYTKGIPRRLLAVDRLLEREPSLRGKLRLIQVSVPSRTKVTAYQDFRRKVDELVGRINGSYGTPGWTPIHYIYRSLSERQVAALYMAADVMLVTPLRDGMNLVAKEFVATRKDEDGVLILSEFAGASSELGEALIVNPYDVLAVGDAIKHALAMPEDERRRRMRAMRRTVAEYDVHRWARTFLEALEPPTDAEIAAHGITREDIVQELALRVREADELLLVLDCDGTILPFAQRPSMAGPDKEIHDLLAALARRSRTHVHVVSGRTRETLEAWFGSLPLGLHAEHGFWSRPSPSSDWITLQEPAVDWKHKVRPILETFTARTPGSIVEEKASSLAWHYRMADVEFGALQAKELRLYLSQVLSNLPVEVLLGSKVLEVRHHGVHKGLILPPLIERGGPRMLSVAIGDDRTDEDLFASLPPGGVAIHVGPLPSRAPYRLADTHATRRFLRLIAESD
jgi:trehalose 6-phosphate synthase/phosphatase